MKKIFVIFECDSHRSQSSYCIKYMSANVTFSNKKYVELKKKYKDNKDCFLNIAEYEPNVYADTGSNVLSELVILKTTEKDGE